MAIRLYNTLSGKKEDFVPLEEGRVRMYACGITVYDECHIGHARQAIIYDVMSRYFKYRGYAMTYVRNYTDVDDKIITRAQALGVSALDYSAKKIQEAEADLSALGILPADISPKVSDHMPEIIDMIAGLIKQGYAYATDVGNVYYDVKQFGAYGKLSNRKIEELEHGKRKDLEEDKRDPLDFALWKRAKEGEINWVSPWGKGRPGWHIECSAMSMKFLGKTFDIHGGGKDLIFPHHENEIAQSEAFSGKPFARYWVHNGLITTHGQKMSKSLGNSMTIKDVLARYHADVVRFGMLDCHYASNLDLSYEAFDKAEKHVYSFYKTLAAIRDILSNNSVEDGAASASFQGNFEKLLVIESDFVAAMDDDLNTSLAISNFFTLFKQLNELIANKKIAMAEKKRQLQPAYAQLEKILDILGLLQQEPSAFIHGVQQKYLEKLSVSEAWIENKIQARSQAKAEKQYEMADQIRGELIQRGILLKDMPQGTEWDIQALYVFT